jgi:hypothetical protein
VNVRGGYEWEVIGEPSDDEEPAPVAAVALAVAAASLVSNLDLVDI